jgi:hypothetical protein
MCLDTTDKFVPPHRFCYVYVQGMKEVLGPWTDIPAPDIGTDERVMAWIFDEFSKHKGFSPAVTTGKVSQTLALFVISQHGDFSRGLVKGEWCEGGGLIEGRACGGRGQQTQKTSSLQSPQGGATELCFSQGERGIKCNVAGFNPASLVDSTHA